MEIANGSKVNIHIRLDSCLSAILDVNKTLKDIKDINKVNIIEKKAANNLPLIFTFLNILFLLRKNKYVKINIVIITTTIIKVLMAG